MVGSKIGPDRSSVDERWTMAYAAALDDDLDCYFDTRRAEGVVAHPVFPVCVSDSIIVRSQEIAAEHGVSADEWLRDVHATHDLTIHRLIRPGDELATTLTVAGVEQRSPGAFAMTRLETIDAHGEPVASTDRGVIFVGVPAEGPDRPAPPLSAALDLPAPPELPRAEITVPLAAGAAHTYTECARIWNPIHTDAAVAAAAGLPAIILHGTATLAHAVSRIVAAEADNDPTSVRRIICRFRAMVLMPSTITIRILDRRSLGNGSDAVQYDVRTVDGTAAIDGGVVVLG